MYLNNNKIASSPPLLIILGPTASGKTHIATQFALQMQGEVISADSRQVYRGMNIGTGKDLDEYVVGGKQIPYHLIDVIDAGMQYNIHQFQQDFHVAYQQVVANHSIPIVCGGSGMYIHALIADYRFTGIPVNEEIRTTLANSSYEEVFEKYEAMDSSLREFVDVSTRKRLIRAIEIAHYAIENPEEFQDIIERGHIYDYVCVGLNPELNLRRNRISKRLTDRLNSGLIEEVEGLRTNGLSDDQLIYYGLEYKYVTQFLNGELSRSEMHTKLETEIHRFAKRQMTFFRKMEKDGVRINWIDPASALPEVIHTISSLYQSKISNS